MKIGILTLFHGNNNWGGNLQGYALKRYIEDNFPNTVVDIIRYRSVTGTNVVYSNQYEQMLQYGPREIGKKFLEKIVKKKNPVAVKLKRRNELFADFQKICLTNDYCYTDEELQDLADEYDCLICGSDQIWNPNVARPGYFLKGITNTRKISYAASIARDQLSKKETKAMIPLIKEFDFISVREKTAKDILDKHLFGIKDVYEVIDPALLRTKEEWESIIGKSDVTKKYALAFFFSDSACYRDNLLEFCKSHNLELVGIPHASRYIERDEDDRYTKLYDIGPIEFLKLFRDASFIFTDSFHGAAFSILFEKNFCVFERDKKSRVSKNSRLYDLLEKFNLSSRMIKNDDEFHKVLNKNIDYDVVNTILYSERQKSANFLCKAIKSVVVKEQQILTTVADLSNKECTGCSYCINICPQKCISIIADKEGFMYPKVEENRCIKCGLCLKNCITKKTLEKGKLQETFIAYNPNEDIRKESSSGGIFSLIATDVLMAGGVVYGAALDEKQNVVHMRITNKFELNRIMRSKYVQSRIDLIWNKIEEDLIIGRKVLFSGTPCQVASVYAFAQRKNLKDNLLLLDFICHGVPSPGVWHSYIQFISQDSEIHEVNFRDKSHAGWHDYYFQIKYRDNTQFSESHEVNAYMYSFLSDKNIRPSCYLCNFKGNNYYSDITLADAWKIEKEHMPWADDKGTSVLIVRSSQGKEHLERISTLLKIRKSDYEFWARMNPSLVNRTLVGSGRKQFFQDFCILSKEEFWKKYSIIPLKKKIRYIVKRVIKTIGLERVLRKIK